MLKVKSVRDLGPQFKQNPHKMVGQDGAYSIPLNKNEALWFFGDTLVGAREPGKSLWFLDNDIPIGPEDMSGRGTIERMLNNTGLILSNKTGRHGLTDFKYILDDLGQLKPMVRLLPDEDKDVDRIWCQHGLAIGAKIYLSIIKIRMLSEPEAKEKQRILESGQMLPVNFEIIGSGLAVGRRKDWEFRRIEHKGTYILWDETQPRFASAILYEPENDWVYMYGVNKDGNDVQSCYLARVRPDNIEHLTRYQYLCSDKPEWSSDLDSAIVVFTGMPNEMSVSYNHYLGCYLAVHSLSMSQDIVGRTAANPWGPWSEPHKLWTTQVTRERELPYPIQTYAGKEHVELAEENGRILYITYIEFEEYFPHLLEITLE